MLVKPMGMHLEYGRRWHGVGERPEECRLRAEVADSRRMEQHQVASERISHGASRDRRSVPAGRLQFVSSAFRPTLQVVDRHGGDFRNSGGAAEVRRPIASNPALASRLAPALQPTSSRKVVGMNIVKWTPFRELEDMQMRLNRFFNDTLPRRTEGDGLFFADFAPLVDIQETENEYVIKAELPEVKKEDVKVEVLNGVLTIEGERKQEKEEKGKRFHKVERSYGKFVRQFALPVEVEAGKVEAEFKDGMLNVHLPKTTAIKPKTIEVKVA
jgi:HSP20 family protein